VLVWLHKPAADAVGLDTITAAHGIVAVGERSAERRGPIEAGLAPDFTLPQLDGGTFTFSSLGRRKKLLLAWSSW